MKKTAGAVYVHKSALRELNSLFEKHDIDIYRIACHVNPLNRAGDNITVYKLSNDGNRITFICSPDFDTANEPIVGDAYCYDTHTWKLIRHTKGGNKVYHHKWQFVKPDYTGFDVEESKKRSELINANAEVQKNRNRIGNLTFWRELLEREGIPV